MRWALKVFFTVNKNSGAKVIQCEATPVPEHEAGRKVGDAVKYNAIVEKLISGKGVSINRLQINLDGVMSELNFLKDSIFLS